MNATAEQMDLFLLELIKERQREDRIKAMIDGALNILILGWSEMVVINW